MPRPNGIRAPPPDAYPVPCRDMLAVLQDDLEIVSPTMRAISSQSVVVRPSTDKMWKMFVLLEANRTDDAGELLNLIYGASLATCFATRAASHLVWWSAKTYAPYRSSAK